MVGGVPPVLVGGVVFAGGGVAVPVEEGGGVLVPVPAGGGMSTGGPPAMPPGIPLPGGAVPTPYSYAPMSTTPTAGRIRGAAWSARAGGISFGSVKGVLKANAVGPEGSSRPWSTSGLVCAGRRSHFPRSEKPGSLPVIVPTKVDGIEEAPLATQLLLPNDDRLAALPSWRRRRYRWPPPIR